MKSSERAMNKFTYLNETYQEFQLYATDGKGPVRQDSKATMSISLQLSPLISVCSFSYERLSSRKGRKQASLCWLKHQLQPLPKPFSFRHSNSVTFDVAIGWFQIEGIQYNKYVLCQALFLTRQPAMNHKIQFMSSLVIQKTTQFGPGLTQRLQGSLSMKSPLSYETQTFLLPIDYYQKSKQNM